MEIYISIRKTNIILHLTTEYNSWYLEMFDDFKPVIKKSQTSEEKVKKIVFGNRIIEGDELDVIKAKLYLMAP